jgi:deoxyinosine 3'endonuclease (endonuclease V)
MLRYCGQTLDKALRHKVKREELIAMLHVVLGFDVAFSFFEF